MATNAGIHSQQASPKKEDTSSDSRHKSPQRLISVSIHVRFLCACLAATQRYSVRPQGPPAKWSLERNNKREGKRNVQVVCGRANLIYGT